MRRFARRETIDETLERLRLVSAECSSDGVEETDAGQVVEATPARKEVKEYCAECNISFGLAEPRVAIDGRRVMHEDCYIKHLAKKANPALPAGLRLM